MSNSKQQLVLSLLLFVAAAVFAVAFIAALIASFLSSPAQGFLAVLAAPAQLAFESFSFAAVYLPLFLLLQGLQARRQQFNGAAVLALSLFLLPAICAGLALRFALLPPGELAELPFLANIESVLTRGGAIAIFGLLAVLFSLLILQLPGLLRPRQKDTVESWATDSPVADSLPSFIVPEITTLSPVPEPSAEDLRRDAWFTSDEPEDQLETLDAELDNEEEEEEEAIESLEAVEQEIQAENEELSIFFSRGRIRELDAEDEIEAEAEAEAEAEIEPEDEEALLVEEELVEEELVEEEVLDESLLPPPAPQLPASAYRVPIAGVLDKIENTAYWEIDAAARAAGEVLRTTLEEFGIQAEVTGIRKGPVITMFEILPAPGVKLARIVNLADNIALRLAASSVRIVAPIPGKHAVGIEIPNKVRHLVGFAELLSDPAFEKPEHEIPVALGKDITGDSQIIDITKTPHLLIAGATGSGKSVCVNSLICSVLYRRNPAEVKMILIDPKIVELKFYNDIPHLLTPVITDPKKAFQALQWCIYEMERRYTLLDAMAVRDIKSFNKKIKAKAIATTPLPYIVVVVDEFADLMATTGKELESTLARLAAMSRAVGIHLVLATQRPSTDVITGLIKANIPTRIAFMVASKVDSRIILDTMGADKLLGRGDMLYTSATDPFPVRIQGAYLSEEEVERVVSEVKKFGKPEYIDDEIFIDEDEDDGFYQQDLEDPLLEKAMEIVTSAGKASASYLQRRLKIGYNRAARLVEHLEQMGVVGPQNGSKAREILRAY